MKNIIFENEPSFDGIPIELRTILSTRFTSNREIWYSFSDNFKRDKEQYINDLLKLPTESNLIGQTCFHEHDTIESIFNILVLLMSHGIRANLFTYLNEELYPSMEAVIGNYLSMLYCYSSPAAMKTPAEKMMFKNRFNDKIVHCMKYHTLYRLSLDGKDKEITALAVLEHHH